jgi:hypothetical protein
MYSREETIRKEIQVMAITTEQRTQLIELYVAIAGRAPDASGLSYWANEMETKGYSIAEIAAFMYDTDDAKALYPRYLTSEEVATAFYVNVLGRTPDAEGLAYWTAKLNENGVVQTMQDMIYAVKVYDGEDPAGLTSKQLFADKLALSEQLAVVRQSDDLSVASTSFEQLEAGVSLEDVLANLGSGSEFTLTNGTDVATANVFESGLVYTPGGDDRINSLQDEDRLTGTGTNPTLNASLGNANDNGATIITPELNGIETVNVAFTGSGAAVTALDLQDATGLNEVNITRVSQAVNSAEVGNIQNTLESMSIANSNSNQAGTVEFSYTAGALAGENTSTLELSNVSLAAVNVGQNTSGIAARNVGTQGYENLTINSTGANNSVNTLNLPMDTGSNGAITITGDTDLNIAGSTSILNAAGLVEATQFINGIATTNGRLATIDASALEGSLTLNIQAGLLSTGKADTSGVAQDVTITGSANADTFYLNDVVQQGDTIDGGDGEDTLVVYTGGVTTGTVSNIENLDIQATGAVTMDMDQLAETTSINIRNIDNFAGASANTGVQTVTLNNLTVEQAANLNLQHSTTNNGAVADTVINANLKDATGANDLVAVEITDGVNADPRFNFTLNTNAVENVTLTDSDTESNTVLLGNVAALTGTLTLEGGEAGDFLNLDSTANLYRYDQSGLTTGDAVGVAEVGLGAAERLVARTVDASAFVGNAVVRVSDTAASNGAQTITMGSGNDTVIFDDLNDNTAGLTISDSVDGGEGDDVLAIDGHGVNINISASEWTNVSNFETVHLVGNGQASNNALNAANAYNLTLTDDFISNNGVEVAGGRLINIVNDNDPNNSVSTVATAGVATNTGVTIDARQLSANRNFSYDGEEGAARTADRFIMSDANINGLAVIDGGAVFTDGSNTTSSVANADVMEVRNAAVVTIGDLANVSNIGTLEFTNDQAITQNNNLVLDSETVDRLVNTTRNADATNIETLNIFALDNDNVAGSNTVLNLDARQVGGAFALNVDTVRNIAGQNTNLNAGNDTAQMAVNLGGATQTLNLGAVAGADTDTVTFTGTADNIVFAAGSLTFRDVTGTSTQVFNLTGVDVLDFSSYVDTGAAANTIAYGTAVTDVDTLTVATSTANWTITDTANTLTTLIGGAGNDTITGGTAVTGMTGGAGNDVLNAAASTGAVTITGGAGNDTITAGAAGSTITGGAGADAITATNGQVDTLVFTAASDSTAASFDTITNFVGAGAEDIINLNGVLNAGNAAPAAITTAAAALNGTAAEFAGNAIAFHDDGTNTTVYVDVNGDNAFGAGDMQIELAGTALGLVVGDFIV